MAPMPPQPQMARRQHPQHSDRPTKQGKGTYIYITILTAILTGLLGFAIGTRVPNVSVSQLNYGELSDVYNQLATKYDGKLNKDELLTGAAKGMVDAVGDPYTEYMTADEYSQLEGDLSGSFSGIGVEIGLNGDGVLSVINPLDGSPAKAAGLQAGDLIEKVDGKDATKWSVSEAAAAIRGEKGTKVKLTVVRDGEEKTFEVTRDTISNPSVKWEVKDGIGYMRISDFGEDTADLARQAAKEFKSQNVKGVILDLRDNTGGYVDAAQSVSSLWLKPGTTITTERSDKRTLDTVRASGDDPLNGIKTVVLINGATASASEITAGALRDQAGATLVGTKSFGKGLVQEVTQLKSGDYLKVTVAKWYTPKGANIDKAGLEPDEKVEMTAEQYNSGNDTQRQKAVELLNK